MDPRKRVTLTGLSEIFDRSAPSQDCRGALTKQHPQGETNQPSKKRSNAIDRVERHLSPCQQSQSPVSYFCGIFSLAYRPVNFLRQKRYLKQFLFNL
jgi:hypothetical protein